MEGDLALKCFKKHDNKGQKLKVEKLESKIAIAEKLVFCCSFLR